MPPAPGTAGDSGSCSGSEPNSTHSMKKQPRPASALKSASQDQDQGRAEDDAAEGNEKQEGHEEDEQESKGEAILDAQHPAKDADSDSDPDGAKEIFEAWVKKQEGGRKPLPRAKAKTTPASQPLNSSAKNADADLDAEEEPEAAPASKRGRPAKAASASARGDSAHEDEEEPASNAKKPRKSAGTSAPKGRRKSNVDAMDEDGGGKTYAKMGKWKDESSWEHLVDSIDTVERTDGGDIMVYFTLKNRQGYAKEKSEICRKKMPDKLIDFYENLIRWRDDDVDAMEE